MVPVEEKGEPSSLVLTWFPNRRTASGSPGGSSGASFAVPAARAACSAPYALVSGFSCSRALWEERRGKRKAAAEPLLGQPSCTQTPSPPTCAQRAESADGGSMYPVADGIPRRVPRRGPRRARRHHLDGQHNARPTLPPSACRHVTNLASPFLRREPGHVTCSRSLERPPMGAGGRRGHDRTDKASWCVASATTAATASPITPLGDIRAVALEIHRALLFAACFAARGNPGKSGGNVRQGPWTPTLFSLCLSRNSRQ